jgi:hypothetical protein
MDGQVTPMRTLFIDRLRHRSRELTRAFSAVREVARGSDAEVIESRSDREIVRGVD